MANGFFNVPFPKNEPVLNYAPGSSERRALKQALAESQTQQVDIPMYIGAEEVRTQAKQRLSPPHDHKRTVGYYSEGDREHVIQAIDAALAAKPLWANLAWESRAAIFLKAA